MTSIKKLVNEKPIKSVRLWGKIFGSKANYIIVETEFKEGVPDEEDQGTKIEAAAPPEAELDAENPEKDAPKPKSKATKNLLTVEKQSGVNKYVYYVCSYGNLKYSLIF